MAGHAGDFADASTELDRRLNERNYGTYNGRRKNEIVDELGYEEYLRIRRDLEHRPPPMSEAQRQRFAAGHPFLTCTPDELAGRNRSPTSPPASRPSTRTGCAPPWR